MASRLDRWLKRTPAEADALMNVAMSRPDFTPWSRPIAPISEDQALRHSAVFGSSTMLSDMVGAQVDYRRMSEVNGFLKKTAMQPQLLTNPSDIVSPIQWKVQGMMSVLLRGNAFGIVTQVNEEALTSDAPLEPERVEWINPRRVGYRPPKRSEDYASGVSPEYIGWTVDSKPRQMWPVGDLVQFAGYTMPGNPVGLSVLSYAASAIGLGLAAEAFGRDWFTDGAHPSGLLTFDGKLTQGQTDDAKKQWRERFNNRRDVAVLAGDWDYKQVQIQANDSQFLETINADVGTVARFFRMPPEMIGASVPGGSLTYATVEGRFTSLLVLTLGHWVARMEEFQSRLLAPGTLVKGDTSLFTTPDQKTQAQIEDLRISNGSWSRDDARAKRGEDPIEAGDGDLYNWPPHNRTLPAEGESEDDAPPMDGDPLPSKGPAPYAPGGNLQ